MRCPVYIPWFEPRTRRRWWTSVRRAKAIAKEALTGGPMPERFYISIAQQHPNNPQKDECSKFFAAHYHGSITTLVTTSSFD